MAGGIDWFRWHHGSVTDPKFQLVARKAGASLPDVLAVWAYLLERASSAEFRGCFGEIDCEAVDCLFGFDDGVTDAVMGQMVARQLIADQYVIAWEKRQPKREDETANDRKRRQREREHEAQIAEMSRTVTHGHAEVTHGHAREEKSREEEKKETKTARKRAAPSVLVSLPELVADGVEEQHATDWLVARKAKSLPLTPTAWADVKAEAIKARMTPGEAIKAAAGNGWAGFKAAWLHEPARNGPHQSAYELKAADAAKWIKGTSLDRSMTFDIEANHAATPALR